MLNALRGLFKLNPGQVGAIGAAKDVQQQAAASEELVKPPGSGHGDRGILVEAMGEAFNTKDYEKLRALIREKLEGHMYEDGEEHIPIKTLVENRNKERKTNLKNPVDNGNEFKYEADMTRACCWKIDERGSVGETFIHMCCLNNLKVHKELLKEIINLYPKLLRDIYLADEYYGEAPLHMLIANEDAEMVKFVLEKGKDIGLNLNERCCGNFFCPEDQKSSRHDNPRNEAVEVSAKTNYKGYMYWGEYPLSFAACLNQEEIFKLLLEYGADISMQDSNGNNVLHMMVIHDNKDMFNLACRSSGDTLEKQRPLLEAKNRQGYTPLTLAAKLANKDMFNHLLEMKSKLAWAYGDVVCAEYPLSDLDTINSKNGSINSNSALSIILSEDTDAHLDMLDGLMYQLLHDKWKAYAKVHFYRRMLLYAVYLGVFIAVIYLQPTPDPNNSCYLMSTDTGVKIARISLELLLCVASLFYLIYDAFREVRMQGIHPFLWSLSNAPTKLMFLVSCVFVLLTIPVRITCSVAVENVFITICICTCIPHCLFYFRGFKLLGPFIVMIYKMILGDLMRFLIIYSIFLMGFSQAMFVVTRSDNEAQKNSTSFDDPVESILIMFSMLLGEFKDTYDEFDYLSQPITAKFLFVIYLVLVTILLLNMLIAMMGNTFNRIKQTKREWKRQWAKIVLVIEQSISAERRKRKQGLYSKPLGDNPTEGRAILTRNHIKVKNSNTKSTMDVVNKLQHKLMMKRQSVLSLDRIAFSDNEEDDEN